MSIDTVLVIGGTSYDRTARLANRIRLSRLTRTLDGGYDEASFSVVGGAPTQAFLLGTLMSVTVDFGAGPVTKFQGEITDLSWGIGPHGWIQGYTAAGLKYLTDRVPITAPDRTGEYTLNRQPDDPYYAPSDAGLTLGQVFTRILKIDSVAQALSDAGISYTSLGPAVLPAATVTSLALLTVVPRQPVALSGEGIFNTLDQHLARWMPKFVTEIRPDGVILFKDTTDTAIFVPRTLTLPSHLGLGDPGVAWPTIRASARQCATRIVIRGGPQAAVALLSTADGTLTRAWTTGDQTAWKLTDFTAPKDGKDEGAITAVTANTATIDSDDNTKAFASNFWSGRQAVIYLTNTVAAGIALTEFRRVTANTAMTAGGTATITWDASQPLDNSGYDKYRVVASAGSKADVSRLYWVTEPSSGDTGLDTFIGAHLITRSPIPLPWANNSKSVEIFAAEGIVVGGGVTTEVPIGVEVLPGSGQIRLTQPAVTAHGQPSRLNLGYPTTANDGLPTDVQVLVIYSRGSNEAVAPADLLGVPQYEGSAFTDQNLQVTRYIDVPSYVDQWDAVGMAELAQQHLDAVKDVVYDGQGDFYGDPGFDFLEFDYSLNYAISGTTSPWSAIDAPVKSVSLEWPDAAGYQHRVTFGFSTQRRPFAGDDLYLHPSFTGGSLISQFEGSIGTEMYAGTRFAGDMPLAADPLQGHAGASDALRQMSVDPLSGHGDAAGGLRDMMIDPNSPFRQAAAGPGGFDPGDFFGGSGAGPGNNFRSNGLDSREVRKRRQDALEDPGRQIQPETAEDAARRMAKNRPRQPMSREEALDQDAARRFGIEQDEARTREGRPQAEPRPAALSREDALAQDAARRDQIGRASREQAQEQDEIRRVQIAQDWERRHKNEDMAGGG